MTNFDFIQGEDFRSSLEADYREMNLAMEVGAWKATHVLAGSIIEALLADHLITSAYNGEPPDNILSKGLNYLIITCSGLGIITDKTKQLSLVVNEYRNLIHPGKVIREQMTVDKEGATVASALVNMVIREITVAKQVSYGYTAEQIADKIVTDSAAISVLSGLLTNTNDHEKFRLLSEILPQRYFYLWNLDEPVGSALSSIGICFREIYENVSVEIKRKTANSFIKIIKEGTGSTIDSYLLTFFKAADLEHYPSDDVQLIKRRIFLTFPKALAND